MNIGRETVSRMLGVYRLQREERWEEARSLIEDLMKEGAMIHCGDRSPVFHEKIKLDQHCRDVLTLMEVKLLIDIFEELGSPTWLFEEATSTLKTVESEAEASPNLNTLARLLRNAIHERMEMHDDREAEVLKVKMLLLLLAEPNVARRALLMHEATEKADFLTASGKALRESLLKKVEEDLAQSGGCGPEQ